MVNKILKSCYFVTNNSKHINIDYQKVDSFLRTIKVDDIKHWLSDSPYGLFGLGVEKAVNLMLLYQSIDYSFWGEPKWTVKTKLGDKDGSDALLFLMINYAKENNRLDFTKVSYDEFKELLKGNVEIPLLKERYKTIVEVSNIVNEKMNGNFYKFVHDVTKDTELLDIIIENFPSFKDERVYNGKTIYFYKLAQLLTSDILHLREQMEGIEVDYSNLLGCADYKIPQTMRALDILVYDDELSEIVDNKVEIKASSVYEVEIRASMIVVIDYIKNRLKNQKAIDINDYFFIASKKVKEKTKPYHLCRNQNY